MILISIVLCTLKQFNSVSVKFRNFRAIWQDRDTKTEKV